MGHLVFHQYLPAKSHKYDIKVYKLCTPEGYTYNFTIYCGRNDNVSSKQGHTFDVAMKLMDALLNEGRILYIDNYYTNVKLADYLLQNDTFVSGTLRTNRKENPRKVSQWRLKKEKCLGWKMKNGFEL